MKFLKWLFQPAYILLAIVLVAVYVNREQLFSENIASSMEVDALLSKADQLIEQINSSSEQSPETADLHTTLTDGHNDEASEISASPETSEAEANEAFVPTPSEIAAKEVVTIDDSTSATETESTTESSNTLVQTEDSGSGTVSQKSPITSSVVEPLSVWRAARTAVWQGDLEESLVQYRKLIELQPSNFDAYGEMGNVLLAQSEVDAAVEAYMQAAKLIHKAGYYRVSRRLVAIVGSLNESRGRELYNELSHY